MKPTMAKKIKFRASRERKRRSTPQTLDAVRPNAGIEAAYRKRLTKLVEEMSNSFEFWLSIAYKQNPPMAFDASPVAQLRIELNKLARRWFKRFNDIAPRIAEEFARSATRQSDRRLMQIMRDGGLVVDMQLTPELREILKAAVAENVQLIKSIPQQYFTQVQGSVMRSVQAGRDLSTLTKELQKHYGVTRRRAITIARDQNNKATAIYQAERQTSIGLEDGIWLHSHGGKVPRPTHLANHGKKFNIREGWHDPDPKVNRKIRPGELINCRCSWKPIVPGLS